MEAVDAEIVPGSHDHLTFRIDGDTGRVVDRVIAELVLAEDGRDGTGEAGGLADAVVVPVGDVEGAGRIDRHVLRPVELGLGEWLAIAVVAGPLLPRDRLDEGARVLLPGGDTPPR